jgi:hypothetical protein
MKKGIPITRDVPTLETSVQFDEANQTVVEIAAEGSADLVERLHALGVQVSGVRPGMHSLRASVSVDQIEAIAALPEVIHVGPRQVGITSRQLERAAAAAQYGTDTSPLTGGRLNHEISIVWQVPSNVLPDLRAPAPVQGGTPVSIEVTQHIA